MTGLARERVINGDRLGRLGAGPMVRLDFCCNDPDNGNFAHRVEQLHGPGRDARFELELSRGAAPRFTIDGAKKRVRLLRRWFPYVAAKGWYGNWCWDAYWFKPEIAAQLLAHVHKSGKFDCSTGETRFFNLWRRRDLPLNQTFVARGLVKSTLEERPSA